MFSIGGIVIFSIEYLFTAFLTEVLGLWHMLSYAIALLVSLVLYFFYHSHVTFKVYDHRLKRFSEFCITFFGSMICAWILVFLVTALGIIYLKAIPVIAAIMAIINYFINKYWVFGSRKQPAYPPLLPE
jgi:putative flippase GtrA